VSIDSSQELQQSSGLQPYFSPYPSTPVPITKADIPLLILDKVVERPTRFLAAG